MNTSPPASLGPLPARGAAINPTNRFERLHVTPEPGCPPDEQPHPRTQFFLDASESILSRNDSPDLPFTYGLNPYRA